VARGSSDAAQSAGMSAKSFLSSPVLYVIWALTVLAALCGSYFADPYVFGLATLGLAWLTAAVGILGISIILVSKRLRTRDRAVILAALVIAAAAIAEAFRRLGTFNWA
jgi:hypothetical protein